MVVKGGSRNLGLLAYLRYPNPLDGLVHQKPSERLGDPNLGTVGYSCPSLIHAADVLEQCHKLEDAGIDYWMTFLGGVAGAEHSRDHAINSARAFSQCKPMLVGTGALTPFPGTPLLEEARRGEFDPLSERGMLEELKLFVEHLDVDCTFVTHHTVAASLTGPDFLDRKERIVAALDRTIRHGDHDWLAAVRRSKRTL